MDCAAPFDIFEPPTAALMAEAVSIKDIPRDHFPSARDESARAPVNTVVASSPAIPLRFSVSPEDVAAWPWIAARWVAVASDAVLYRLNGELRLYITGPTEDMLPLSSSAKPSVWHCCPRDGGRTVLRKDKPGREKPASPPTWFATWVERNGPIACPLTCCNSVTCREHCCNTPCSKWHSIEAFLRSVFTDEVGGDCEGDLSRTKVVFARAMAFVAFAPSWYVAELIATAVRLRHNIDSIAPHLQDLLEVRGTTWADLQYLLSELSIELRHFNPHTLWARGRVKTLGERLGKLTEIVYDSAMQSAAGTHIDGLSFEDRFRACKSWFMGAWNLDGEESMKGKLVHSVVVLGLLSSASQRTLPSWTEGAEDFCSRNCPPRRSEPEELWQGLSAAYLATQLVRLGFESAATYLCSTVTVPVACGCITLDHPSSSGPTAYRLMELSVQALMVGCIQSAVWSKGVEQGAPLPAGVSSHDGLGCKKLQSIFSATTVAAGEAAMWITDDVLSRFPSSSLTLEQRVNLTVPLLPTHGRVGGPLPSWKVAVLLAVDWDVSGEHLSVPNFSWLRIDHYAVYWCMMHLRDTEESAALLPEICTSAFESLWLRDVIDDDDREPGWMTCKTGFTSGQLLTLSVKRDMPSTHIVRSYSMLTMLEWYCDAVESGHTLQSWLNMPFAALIMEDHMSFFDSPECRKLDGVRLFATQYGEKMKTQGLYRWPKMHIELKRCVTRTLWGVTHGPATLLGLKWAPECSSTQPQREQASSQELERQAAERARLRAEAEARREQRRAERKAKKELARQEEQLTPDEAADWVAKELMRSALHQVLYETHIEQESRAAREASARRRQMVERERLMREARDQQAQRVHHAHDHRAPNLFPLLEAQPRPEQAVARMAWTEAEPERKAQAAANKQRKEAADAEGKRCRSKKKEARARKNAPCDRATTRQFEAPSQGSRSAQHLGDAIEAAEIAAARRAPPVVAGEELAEGEEAHAPVVRGA